MDTQTRSVTSSGRRCQTVSRKAAPDMPWSLSVEVGDIVKLKPESWRTDRIALVVERFNALICWVIWSDTGEREKVNSQYFEVINASR